MMKRTLIAVSVLAAILVPVAAQAAPDWWPIVPCGLQKNPDGTPRTYTLQDFDANGNPVGLHDYSQDCNQCLLVLLFKNGVDMVFFTIVPLLGTFFFIWAGFLILVGARSGKAAEVTKGIGIFQNTFIGILIILSSWLVTNFILKALAGENNATQWYEIQCTTGKLAEAVNATVPHPNPDPQSPSGGTQPSGPGTGATAGTCTGAACARDTADVCGPVDPGDGCNASAVNGLNAAIVAGAGSKTIAAGVDTVKLLKAVIANESDGRVDIGSRDGLSSGPFQLTLATVNPIRQRCRIGEPITFGWLRRNDTVSQQACLAAEILKDVVPACGTSVRQLAAGYNGGPGACRPSNACGGTGACSVCPEENRATRRWECLWEDTRHTMCNVDRPNDRGYSHTRIYAPRVEYCYNAF